jgi:hypothetical protein
MAPALLQARIRDARAASLRDAPRPLHAKSLTSHPPPQFPHRLRGFLVICAVVIQYTKKKLGPCPQLEQRLSRMSAAIACWVSIQA